MKTEEKIRQYLKAYINYDAISSFPDVKGQVEIYDEFGNNDYESFETEQDMQDRVDYINNNNFTWLILPSYFTLQEEV